MIIEVKVPVFAESITEGTLLSWHKKVGDAVTRDETLVDIETDKVVLEVPAPQSGVLVEIVVQDGETVTSEQFLAKIDTEAAAATAAPAAQPAPAAAPAAEAAPSANTQAGVALPAAAKLAAETGVDVASIQGSGRDGRTDRPTPRTTRTDEPPAYPRCRTPAGFATRKRHFDHV